MTDIRLWNRLSTRLSLLILVIVLVLAGATAILLQRGFNRISNETVNVETGLGVLGVEAAAEFSDIVRSTIVNLVAVFLLTLVGATVFSRSLLTEPISSLLEATQDLATGKLGVTLPVTSQSELGMLAVAFNQMSKNLTTQTQELIAANEALKQSETRLEQRVQERTSELIALLELSNSIALTVEDMPLIEHIFDELHDITAYKSAVLLECLPAAKFQEVIVRGKPIDLDDKTILATLEEKLPQSLKEASALKLIFPCIVRDKVVGVLLLDYEALESLSQEKMRLITAFANQAGVALENTKLYADVQEKAAFEERQHLARELHDSVSQALYSIVLGVHAAIKQMDNPKKASQALDYVQNLAEAGLAEMRALIFELRPEVLEQEGLNAALQKQVEALEVRHGLVAELEADKESDLPFATKQALFRIAQEALHNIVKHAKAKNVKVHLVNEALYTELIIVDDGIGFDTAKDYPGHLGLKSMRERALSLGGQLNITSKLKQGTQLRVEVPHA